MLTESTETQLPLSSRPLGKILVLTQAVSPRTVEEALAAQTSGDEMGRLGEILVRRKLVDEEKISRAVALQFDLEFRERSIVEDVDQNLVAEARFPFSYAMGNRIVPIRRLPGGAILTAVTDPTQTGALDEARLMLGASLALVVVTTDVAIHAIHRAYDRSPAPADAVHSLGPLSTGDQADVKSWVIQAGESDDAPVIRYVNALLVNAIKERASDIHIEPYEDALVIRYRVDGVLRHVAEPPKYAQNAMVSRIKVMADLDIAEKRLPQDGRIRLTHFGRQVDVRLSTAPTVFGERIVMRLLERTQEVLNLAEIGFEPHQLRLLEGLLERPHGLILVTGPTGAGKTTTLYAALARLSSPELNIMTIENPVEYNLRGVAQMAVNPKIDLTFANALRCFLRQDPDVIMVGEIRDPETAEIAIQAALTGHLVFSTVHTNDAAGAIVRLVDMGIERFLVASSLCASVAQRLVRRLCRNCRIPCRMTAVELIDAGIARARVAQFLEGSYFEAGPGGCPACDHSGYHGRTAIYEVLLVDDEVRKRIHGDADANAIMHMASERQEMLSLREAGIHKASQGMTTVAEVLRVTPAE